MKTVPVCEANTERVAPRDRSRHTTSPPKLERELRKLEHELPDLEPELPDLENELLDIEQELPDLEHELPDIEQELPGIERELPDIEQELPDLERDPPKLERDLPKLAREGEVAARHAKKGQPRRTGGARGGVGTTTEKSLVQSGSRGRPPAYNLANQLRQDSRDENRSRL